IADVLTTSIGRLPRRRDKSARGTRRLIQISPPISMVSASGDGAYPPSRQRRGRVADSELPGVHVEQRFGQAATAMRTGGMHRHPGLPVDQLAKAVQAAVPAPVTESTWCGVSVVGG